MILYLSMIPLQMLLNMCSERYLLLKLCLISVYLCFCESTININYSDIDELKYLNTSVDPCDDFYEYACGNFKYFHPLRQSSFVTQFTILRDEILRKMKDILISPDNNNLPEATKRAKDAYKTCLNDNLNYLREVSFIAKSEGMPILQNIQQDFLKFGWNEIGDLVSTYGVPLLFNFNIVPFPVSTTDYLLKLQDDKFSDPIMFHPQESMNYHEIMFKDFSRYASKYDEVDEKQDPFFIYLRTVLTVLKNKINHNIKDEQITSGIKEVAKFMRDIKEYAGISKDANIKQITTTTVVEKLQQWTDEQFENKAPINWLSYLGKIFNKSGARIDLKTNIYVNSNYVYNVLNITRNTDPAVLKNFALIRILLYSSFDGDRKIRTALFNYYKARNHTILSRSDYCANQILDISSDGLVGLSLAASRLFTEEKRQMKAKSLIEKISESFKNKILTSNWMDNKSKAAAMKKKENMISLVGVPDFVHNNKQLNEFYENLRISSKDNYGNMQQLRAFRQNYAFSRLRGPRIRSYWDKSPFETNALYNRANNKFIIPLAMLYPPFFRGDFGIMDYSHLGVLVGHETTHGYDNAGRRYDAFGVIGNLWTNETYSAFENRSQCFRKQYDRYFISELNETLSGERSLNENLADNGGLKIAYNAAKEVFKFYRFESDKFSPEQLFFIGFATTFCSVEDLSYLEYTIDKGYPPSKFRVNGAVSNMKEFSNSFNCPKNSAMNPEDKCSLW